MTVTEVGNEEDVGMIQTKEANKGGTFKDKFKHSGKTDQTPTQVWTYPWEELPHTATYQKIGCGGGGVGDGGDGGGLGGV